MLSRILKKRENLIKINLISTISIVLSVFLFFIMMISHLWFLIWFCFAPAFFVVKREKINNLLFYCLLFVILLNITSFYWFTKYSFSILLISIFLMALFGFFLCVICRLFSFNRILRILIIPIAWSILVILFSFNPLGGAWVNFAFFWPMMAPLIWYIKGIGVTFLILLSNSLIAEYFYKRDKKILIAIIILFLIVVSCFIFSYYGKINGKEIKIAIIQGNINETWNWRLNNPEYIIDKYENLSLSVINEKPDFIIWPEYSIPLDLTKDENNYNRISNLSKKINTTLILGSIIKISNDSHILITEKTDTMLVFSNNGKIIARYDTPLPMPLDKMVEKGKPPYNNNVIKIEKESFIIGLCFEEILLERFRKNSSFIVLLSNNQIFDSSLGTELVSLFPRLIAAENKKFVIRSTNTGVSEIIDKYGKVNYKLETFKEGVLIGKIYI